MLVDVAIEFQPLHLGINIDPQPRIIRVGRLNVPARWVNVFLAFGIITVRVINLRASESWRFCRSTRPEYCIDGPATVTNCLGLRDIWIFAGSAGMRNRIVEAMKCCGEIL
jgi:hypothetical protein